MGDTPQNLHDLYIHELQDLWSANDQMGRVLKKLAGRADSDRLVGKLEGSMERLSEMTGRIREILESHEAKVKKEHCKGMEGLVKEAEAHVLEDGPDKGPVRDAVIIAQYNRMAHYGIAGFGTAASFAGTLGHHDDQRVLRKATSDLYASDDYATELAETCVNLQAVDA